MSATCRHGSLRLHWTPEFGNLVSVRWQQGLLVVHSVIDMSTDQRLAIEGLLGKATAR